MNKLTKEKRDRLLLVGVGTSALLAALYFLVITSQQAALRECLDKTEATKQMLAKAERWSRMASGIEARLNAHRAELESRQEYMAPVDKFKWFYNTLEKFLTRHSVQLVDITREPVVGDVGVLPKFPFQAATFGVKLNAYFHDFGAFLADFENQFPFLRVQNLELEPDAAPGISLKENVAGSIKRAAGASEDPHSERLAITMRVVTLIKPSSPL
jgi:hypothetical protein